MSEEQEFVPIEQHTLSFYGRSGIVMRLSDDRPGVVLRFLCENLHSDTNARVHRVQRSDVMAKTRSSLGWISSVERNRWGRWSCAPSAGDLPHFRKAIINYLYLCNRIRPKQKEQFWQRSPMVMSLCMKAWRPKEKRG